MLLFQCMYYVELKKFKFALLVVILFFTFSFFSLNVFAEEELVLLPDEQTVESNYDDSSYGDRKSHIVKRKLKNQAGLQDRVFIPSNRNVSINGLLGSVSLVVFALLIFLGIAKLVFSRDQFGKPGGLFDEIAQKFTGGLSGSQGMKLKQTLILTPGQNIYLVEIDGRRLLVGGTQQGGVQFLADLTMSSLGNEKFDIRQIDEIPKSVYEGISGNHVNSDKQNKYTTLNYAGDTPFVGQDIIATKNMPDEIKQPIVSQNGKFKRRTNFRQSLFNDSMNGKEELLRKA